MDKFYNDLNLNIRTRWFYANVYSYTYAKCVLVRSGCNTEILNENQLAVDFFLLAVQHRAAHKRPCAPRRPRERAENDRESGFTYL